MRSFLTLYFLVALIGVPVALHLLCQRIKSRHRRTIFLIVLLSWWAVSIVPPIVNVIRLSNDPGRPPARLESKTGAQDQ
jgi:hypothetical protein